MSGLKETFIKRYIVERTNKAEKRQEELSEKTDSCRENLWNETQWKQTSIKRYILERINKTEIRSQEQSQETENCRENLRNEIHLKGP